MTDLKHRYIIDLDGNLRRRARDNERAMKRFSDNSVRRMELLKRSIKGTSRALERMGTGAAVVGAGTMVFAGKQVAELEERITRLGLGFNLAGKDLDDFKKKSVINIGETATKYSVASDQIIEGIEAIATKTGDLDFATKNIDVLAKTLSATDAQGADLGGILSQIQNMGISEPEKVQEILDVLIVQGKNGAFVLKDMASQGERVFAAYGPRNLKQVREMGAVLQSIRSVTGSSEQAVTAFEALLRALRSADKIKLIESGGIQVFDAEALKQGRQLLRPINEIMIDLVKRSGGKATVLNKVLGDSESVKALMGLVNELNATGEVGVNLNRILNLDANDQSAKDSAEAQKTFNAQVQRLRNMLEQYANDNLSELVSDLADIVESLDPEDVRTFFKALTYAAGGLIAFSAALKALRMAQAMKGIFDGLMGGAKGTGGALDAITRVGSTPARPMFVKSVDGLLGGGTGSAGKKGKWASRAGKLGAATIVGGVAYEGASIVNDEFVRGTMVGDSISESMNDMLAIFGHRGALENKARMSKEHQVFSAGDFLKYMPVAAVFARMADARADKMAMDAKLALDVKVSDDRVMVNAREVESGGMNIDIGNTVSGL